MTSTDVERAAGLKRLAFLLDDLIRVPGTNLRFGLDALLGLIPVGGDVAGSVLSAYTLFVAARLGAPASVLLRMGANIAVDAIVGAVPLLGDLFDAGFKANRRNVQLVERYIDDPRPVHRSSRALVAAIVLALLLIIIGAGFVALRLMAWVLGLL